MFKRTYISLKFINEQLDEKLSPSIGKPPIIDQINKHFNEGKMRQDERPRWFILRPELTKSGKPELILLAKNIAWGSLMHVNFWSENLFIPFSIIKIMGGMKPLVRVLLYGWLDRVIEDLKASGRWSLLNENEQFKLLRAADLTNAVRDGDFETIKEIESENIHK